MAKFMTFIIMVFVLLSINILAQDDNKENSSAYDSTIVVRLDSLLKADKNVTDLQTYLDTLNKDNKFVNQFISKQPLNIQVYFYAKKYIKKYKVKESLVFNILYIETHYRGLVFDYNYPRNLHRSCVGPMQILLSTANRILQQDSLKTITKRELMNNVELNIKIGVQLLSILHDQHKTWLKTAGAYNTGRPIVNRYARRANKSNQ